MTPATAKAAASPSPELKALLDRKLAPEDALFIGAGDIARCGAQFKHAQATAGLINRFSPTTPVFTLGDNAYMNGTEQEFNDCYKPTWGGFKQRTWPAPGNHEYGIYLDPKRNNADPYFKYFGEVAGPKGLGYYSRDLGNWHIVSLNSMAGQTGAPAKAQQEQWLEEDLAKNKKPCILAYWHHPLFSSSKHGDNQKDPGRYTDSLWKILRKFKADVILNGHEHSYERFGLQGADGKADPDGLREIVVGTGGGGIYQFGTIKNNSEKRLTDLYGVLLMTLHSNSYEWHLITTDGKIADASSDPVECH